MELIVEVLIIIIAIIYFAKRKNSYVYYYSAKTLYADKDHNYKFRIKKIDTEYRCYIERIPYFRGRSTEHYQYHCWIENATKRRYICWTGKIEYPAQAETLCRNWADATQQFIDTGVPAPGFSA